MNGKEKRDSPSIGKSLLISIGWETWIRTTIHGVRVRCPTIERSPNSAHPITTGKILYQRKKLFADCKKIG